MFIDGKPGMKDIMQALIRHSKDPMLPFVMQNAYSGVERLGQTLAPLSNAKKVEEVSERLMASWTEDEIDSLAKKPEFVEALAGMLAEALITYANGVVEKELN
jgi:hypothetical protein